MGFKGFWKCTVMEKRPKSSPDYLFPMEFINTKHDVF